MTACFVHGSVQLLRTAPGALKHAGVQHSPPAPQVWPAGAELQVFDPQV